MGKRDGNNPNKRKTLENQTFTDHRPNGWSRAATAVILWCAQGVQQQQWDGAIRLEPWRSAWTHVFFWITRANLCLESLKTAFGLDIVVEQSWNKKTGCLISPAAPSNCVHVTTDPKSSHSYLENVQQPKIKEHILLYFNCAERQEEGWPAEGAHSPPALGNNAAHRCMMEQMSAVPSPELTNQQKQYISSVIPTYFAHPRGLIFPSQRETNSSYKHTYFLSVRTGRLRRIYNEKRNNEAGHKSRKKWSFIILQWFLCSYITRIIKKKKKRMKKKASQQWGVSPQQYEQEKDKEE